jgi:hypothetical protein
LTCTALEICVNSFKNIFHCYDFGYSLALEFKTF